MCKITSAATSINKINKIYKNYVFNENSYILDYGCGRYFYNIKKHLERTYENVQAYGYDPYNQNYEENANTFSIFANKYADYIVCSNVLNVIKDDDDLFDALDNIKFYSNYNTKIVFCFYEGDRSGKGKRTSKGWQRNKITSWYIPLLKKNFEILEMYNKIITCKKRITYKEKILLVNKGSEFVDL